MTFTLFASLFIHFFLLSCIAVGGFMATLPGMYSFLVVSKEILTPEQFSATVAFGQSLPGPNMLVAALLGWASGGPFGFIATFFGTCIPFSTIAVLAGRYVRIHAKSLGIKAYKAGMAPVAIGLLFSTGYLLLHGNITNFRIVGWAFIVMIIVWRTHIPMIGLIATGGILGALGILA